MKKSLHKLEMFMNEWKTVLLQKVIKKQEENLQIKLKKH